MWGLRFWTFLLLGIFFIVSSITLELVDGFDEWKKMCIGGILCILAALIIKYKKDKWWMTRL